MAYKFNPFTGKLDQVGAGGATAAGSANEIQYNDGAGGLAASSDFTVDPDWNDASTVFTGLKLNVTDGAGGSPVSASGSNLLDLQSGGTSKIKFDKFGINYGVASAITNYIAIGGAYGATNGFRLYGDTGTLRFASNHTVGWTANATESFTTLDTALVREDAGVVKITDGSTGTGYIKQDPVAITALPAAGTVGAGTRGFVNDASSTTFAAEVALGTNDGGSTVVPVYCDGSTWRIG